jgi:hypothetical protein
MAARTTLYKRPIGVGPVRIVSVAVLDASLGKSCLDG